MALNPYSKVGWQNSPSQATPVNATNLNKMDDQLYDVTDHLINLDASDLPYDNTVSGMTATTMQTAIDEAYKPTFSQALTRTNINSGESLPTLFGKIKKFFADLKTVAFSGSYTDLSNKPTIGNGTLTIQKNGTNVATFTANQTGNATANISVPTNTNQLTNGAGFITSSGSCAYATNAGTASAVSSGGEYIVQHINGTDGVVYHDVRAACYYDWINGLSVKHYGIGHDFLRRDTGTEYAPLTASSFNVASSKRFKRDINDMTDEMALGILSLRPVTYFYNNAEDDKEWEGLIAEEVAEVDDFPVTYDDEGLPSAIDYSKFVPQLIKLCQIQQRQIDDLTARIDALEGRSVG